MSRLSGLKSSQTLLGIAVFSGGLVLSLGSVGHLANELRVRDVALAAKDDELSAARKQAAELSERVNVLKIKLRETQQALEATKAELELSCQRSK